MNFSKTDNDIEYSEELYSQQGASFILFPTAAHTIADIRKATRQIYNERDVVALKIATPEDWDERFRSEIYAHSLTKDLKWYEINANDRVFIRELRLAGMTVEDYILDYVLPLTEKTKQQNLDRYGDKILNY